ncbi:MAG: hypothetical protein AAF635_08095 [Cyanobacteria bacterium P01_C01_bin.69]
MTQSFEYTTFNHLWQIACQEAQNSGLSPRSVFGSIGLRLEPPKAPWRYYCTPKNVRTFASTGQDGVHYSLLTCSELLYSPVVMTVPMDFDNNNIIVGETLHEFLCLGSRAGYGSLESLTSLEADFSALKSHAYLPSLSAMQTRHLRTLSEAFSLYPYVNLERRMAQLQAMYLDYLQLGERALVPTAAFSAGR